MSNVRGKASSAVRSGGICFGMSGTGKSRRALRSGALRQVKVR